MMQTMNTKNIIRLIALTILFYCSAIHAYSLPDNAGSEGSLQKPQKDWTISGTARMCILNFMAYWCERSFPSCEACMGQKLPGNPAEFMCGWANTSTPDPSTNYMIQVCGVVVYSSV